jgi:alginate O-acetyltransferase complex protein AlgI
MSAIGIGLLKKMCGDVMGDFVQPAFAAAREGHSLTLIEAWSAALCFGTQIYLDFSGYTDMAIGLARLFQVQFPTNFYSPYKAASIIEFWHRWHTTLSRFLRDALYRPLGGNRKGRFRRDINLMLTMLLGGLWHGANWTFVAWGGLHGAYLIFNHRLREARGQPSGRRGTRVFGFVVTFIAVTFAWVLFRAETFSTAFVFFKAMLGMSGISLPADYAPKLGVLAHYLRAVGINFAPMPFWAGRDVMQWLIPALLVIFLCPNTTQIFERYKVATVPLPVNPADAIASEGLLSSLLRWQPTLFWRCAVACMLMVGLMMLLAGGSDEFIYFQF